MGWLYPYIGRLIGVTAGIILGVVYLFFGVFHMIVFGMIVFIGYYIGKKQDEKVDLRELLERMMPEKFRRY